MMNLFNLAGHAEHKARWGHPYHARRTAIERCLERAEQNCNETRAASLRHALSRVTSFQKIFEALTGSHD